jgi:hypothetical protein
MDILKKYFYGFIVIKFKGYYFSFPKLAIFFTISFFTIALGETFSLLLIKIIGYIFTIFSYLMYIYFYILKK